MSTFRGLLLAGLLAAGGGCGGSGSGGPSGQATGPTEEATLQDLGAMLKSIAEQKRKPPAKLADLDTYEPIHMAAYKGVASAAVVYLWGAGYNPTGTEVVAYEKAAEQGGGLVLLADGTVKSMTAAEFAAAPKAGKKK